ncbi:polysaccharide biosynthesis PFTS motif protein, partial [Candidatus Pelagibacter sp.]|nr:polysaccharide biosynthesis PFTS motif protein [Candidatus Pelagibacter sp.]
NKIFNNNIFNKMFLFEELFNYYLLNINKYSFDYILFNNPSIVFKPPWVKLNERLIKNSVIFYFYSINIFPLQEKNQKRYFDVNGYALSEWNLFWIWNKGQLNWLRKKVNKVFKYKYIRYLPFEGQYYQQNYKNKKIVTIFDVPPKNLFTKSQLVNSYNHYSFNFCSRFLNDILEVLKNKNIIIIIKIKRDYQNIDLRYKNLILKLKKIKNIKLFYDEISAESLVEKSNLTISSPFTSTALISKSLNKKSIYYNPYLEIHKTGYNPLNIKIISKLENLKTWIDKNL